jgi:probable addiction module antidote protein
MTIETRAFDAAKYLDDEESQRFLLDDAVKSGDAGYIANALGTIARAKGGLSHLERITGIKRQTLNKSLGKEGNPTLETLLPVLKALGLRLRIEPETAKAA